MKKNGLFWVMLGVVLAFGFVVVSCGISKKDLTEQVKSSVEEYFADNGMEDIKIEDITLLEKSKNEYRGILKATYDGESENLTINVSVDGSDFMWEIED